MRYAPGGLSIAARGSSPTDSAPLTCTVPDRSYQAEVAMDLDGGAEGGLLLFYSHKAYVGVGFTGTEARTFEFAEEQPWMRPAFAAKSLRVRVTNDENVVTFRYSGDGGRSWILHPLRMEVSGYHHNVFGGFLSLKVGIYAAGQGHVRLREFRYRALNAA